LKPRLCGWWVDTLHQYNLDLDAKGEYGLLRWRRHICHNATENRLCEAPHIL
jgi:hypothetical protein